MQRKYYRYSIVPSEIENEPADQTVALSSYDLDIKFKEYLITSSLSEYQSPSNAFKINENILCCFWS